MVLKSHKQFYDEIEGKHAMAKPIILQAGEGEKRWFYGGGVHTWKVTPDDLGSFFLFEDEMTEGKVTPWHAHPTSDELAYLIDGEVELKIRDQEARVSSGGMWSVPRGTPHAFMVVSSTARILSLQAPGEAGRFYWEAAEPFVEGADQGVDFERLAEVAASTGATKILGPPPFLPAAH